MKTIVFTLCSNNYLAHAKTLGDSLKSVSPNTEFIIGLVDEFNDQIDYSFFEPHQIIKYDQIGFPFFKDMIAEYNIIEFNTSVKPYYMEFLLNKYGEGAKVYYIDPDIKMYAGLDYLNSILDTSNIVVTPNLTEVPNEVDPGELASLRHGMFNLGFIGVSNTPETIRFLHWWQKRLRTHCIIDKSNGVFVDQKWVDFAPMYFKGTHVLKHKGYNMAWWNFSERTLVNHNGKYVVNSPKEELVFFHFSGYKPGSLSYTGRNNNSTDYALESKPELVDLFEDYHQLLLKNDFNKLSAIKPTIQFAHGKKVVDSSLQNKLKMKVKKFLK